MSGGVVSDTVLGVVAQSEGAGRQQSREGRPKATDCADAAGTAARIKAAPSSVANPVCCFLGNVAIGFLREWTDLVLARAPASLFL